MSQLAIPFPGTTYQLDLTDESKTFMKEKPGEDNKEIYAQDRERRVIEKCFYDPFIMF